MPPKKPIILLTMLGAIVACNKAPRQYMAIGYDENYNIVGQAPIKNPKQKPSRFYTLFFNSKGKITHITYSDGTNLLPDPLFGVAQISITYTPTNEIRTFLDAQSNIITSPSYLHAKAILQYDQYGYPISVAYYSPSNTPALDQRKVFAYRWERDKKHRLIRAIGYDTNTNLQEYLGVAIVEWVYDNQGNLVEQRFYNKYTNLARDNLWQFAIVRYTYDSHHRRTSTSFYDEKGNPVNYSFFHIHKIEYFYDSKGKITNQKRYAFDTNSNTLIPLSKE